MELIIASSNQFFESLEHITGFLIVVVVLLMLWGVTSLIGRIFIGRAKTAVPSSPAPAPVQESSMPSPAEEDIPEEHLAAVTAAIACMLGGRHRIVSIRSGNRDWSREGRREHFASHRIR